MQRGESNSDNGWAASTPRTTKTKVPIVWQSQINTDTVGVACNWPIERKSGEPQISSTRDVNQSSLRESIYNQLLIVDDDKNNNTSSESQLPLAVKTINLAPMQAAGNVDNVFPSAGESSLYRILSVEDNHSEEKFEVIDLDINSVSSVHHVEESTRLSSLSSSSSSTFVLSS